MVLSVALLCLWSSYLSYVLLQLQSYWLLLVRTSAYKSRVEGLTDVHVPVNPYNKLLQSDKLDMHLSFKILCHWFKVKTTQNVKRKCYHKWWVEIRLEYVIILKLFSLLDTDVLEVWAEFPYTAQCKVPGAADYVIWFVLTNLNNDHSISIEVPSAYKVGLGRLVFQ